MRILSIDWDYFQVVGPDLVRLYPEGYDKPTEESILDWRRIYRRHPGVYRVDINRREYNLLIDLLERQDPHIPVMIRQSHIHIYDFIHSLTGENQKIDLVNVDMHHDLLNDTPYLDCGNWIMALIKENMINKNSLRWVSNPISLPIYGLKHLSVNENKLKKVLSLWNISGGLRYLDNTEFDAIYIARSDPWSPPHLDIYFEQLLATMQDLFSNLSIGDSVDLPRII